MTIRIRREVENVEVLECVAVVVNAYTQEVGGRFSFNYMKRSCWVCRERFKPGDKVSIAVRVGPYNSYLCEEHANIPGVMINAGT